jgi:ribosomal protein S26
MKSDEGRKEGRYALGGVSIMHCTRTVPMKTSPERRTMKASETAAVDASSSSGSLGDDDDDEEEVKVSRRRLTCEWCVSRSNHPLVIHSCSKQEQRETPHL